MDFYIYTSKFQVFFMVIVLRLETILGNFPLHKDQDLLWLSMNS